MQHFRRDDLHPRRGVLSRSFAQTLFGALMCACFSIAPLSATTFVRVADSDLADAATVIVEVELVDAVAATTVRPTTDVAAVVHRVIKGDPALSSVTFRQLGGLDPSTGMELQVFGNPELRRGARALLFLVPQEDGSDVFRPLHLFQGFFHVASTDDGSPVAFRSFGEAREVPLSGRKSLPEEGPRDLERFAAWLEDRVAGKHRAADYLVSVDLDRLVSAHQKFSLITRSGLNVRWRDFDGGNPNNPGRTVRYLSHNSGQPGMPSGGHSEFQQALAAWNNDVGSLIQFVYGGRTSASGGLSRFDGVNAILWDDPDEIFDTNFSCASGGTIAAAGPWTTTSPSDRHSFNGRTYVNIVGGDIVTNQGISCWINFNRRAQEVFAHEVGHTLGLGHSCDLDSGGCSNGALNQALMRAQAHGDGRGAALGSDDRAAVAFLYPSNISPPDAPSDLRATAQAPDRVRLDWNDNSGNESSFLVERRVGNGNFSLLTTTGANVRAFTDTAVSSGTSYSYRVTATNSAGPSFSSNVASVTTPGAAAPTNVTAQVLSATSVRLTWTDNSQGETGFEIDADGFGAYFPADRPGANFTLATLDGLNPNTRYTFRIRAVGSPEGQSSYVLSNAVTTLDGTPDPCAVGPDTQCLSGDRFKVQIGWRNFEDASGTASVVDVPSEDSGLFWFFEADNWEMLVKVLDGCVLTDHFWIFAAATTNLEYLLQVIDTETGNAAIYENPLGTSSAAITDTEALPCSGSSIRSDDDSLSKIRRLSTTDTSIRADAAPVGRSSLDALAKMDCAADGNALCLSRERFKVEVDWRDFGDNRGAGNVVSLPVTADDSGLFWFFRSDNWEMLVKVLDGCGINQRFWVFSAATTNVEYTLRVTDTQTGQVREYPNPLGISSPALTDVEAFATCP